MTFGEVIKKSIYNEFQMGGVGFYEIGIILATAFVFGIVLFIAYKTRTRSAFYSIDINISIACMPLVVSSIMIAMQNNILVSLGMVGALSIVRFRTAVKNPIDLLFFFLGISIGIIVGVRLYYLAIVLVVATILLIYVLDSFPTFKAPQLLIIRTDDENIEKIEESIERECKKYKSLSTTIRQDNQELIYYIKCADSLRLVNEIKKISNVKYINIIEHSGEVR